MNPRVSLLVLITSISFSCGSNKEETTAQEPTISKTLVSEADTFFGGKNLLSIVDTTESVFKNFFTWKPDTSEANNLKQNPDVKRNGDTLFITLKNNTVKQLISKPYVEGADDLTEYKYLGKLNSINYHLFYVALYEASAYLMVNADNGKETYMCGKPAISPNKKYLVSSNCDLQAQFDFNGFQMYDITKDSLKLNWDRGLTTWGADNVAWINDNTLVVEKMYLDTNQNVHTGFVKISCVAK
jgi:hypothetical protein